MSAELLAVALQVAVLGLAWRLVEWFAGTALPVWARELGWWLVLLRAVLPAQAPAACRDLGLPAGGDWLAAPVEAVTCATAGSGVAMVWLGGAVLMAVVGGWRYRRLGRSLAIAAGPTAAVWQQAAAAAAARLGLPRVPKLRMVAGLRGPCVVGVGWPVVCLPTASGLAAVAAEHVLMHEFAHVRRRDPLRAVLVLAVQVSWWWHPLVWLAAARLRLARELAADSIAAGHAADGPAGYRSTLLASVRNGLGGAGWLPLPAFGGRSLLPRLTALAARPPRPAAAPPAVLLLVGLAGLLALPPAFRWPSPAQSLQLPGCLATRHAFLQALATEAVPLPRENR